METLKNEIPVQAQLQIISQYKIWSDDITELDALETYDPEFKKVQARERRSYNKLRDLILNAGLDVVKTCAELAPSTFKAAQYSFSKPAAPQPEPASKEIPLQVINAFNDWNAVSKDLDGFEGIPTKDAKKVSARESRLYRYFERVSRAYGFKPLEVIDQLQDREFNDPAAPLTNTEKRQNQVFELLGELSAEVARACTRQKIAFPMFNISGHVKGFDFYIYPEAAGILHGYTLEKSTMRYFSLSWLEDPKYSKEVLKYIQSAIQKVKSL